MSNKTFNENSQSDINIDDFDLDLKTKLNLETGMISWKELEVFFAKGILLQLDKGVDLVETAKQMADDDSESIEPLVKQEKLKYPDIEWVKANCQPSTQLWCVVVAPYVICQLID